MDIEESMEKKRKSVRHEYDNFFGWGGCRQVCRQAFGDKKTNLCHNLAHTSPVRASLDEEILGLDKSEVLDSSSQIFRGIRNNDLNDGICHNVDKIGPSALDSPSVDEPALIARHNLQILSSSSALFFSPSP